MVCDICTRLKSVTEVGADDDTSTIADGEFEDMIETLAEHLACVEVGTSCALTLAGTAIKFHSAVEVESLNFSDRLDHPQRRRLLSPLFCLPRPKGWKQEMTILKRLGQLHCFC